jgi:hypothetical protein
LKLPDADCRHEKRRRGKPGGGSKVIKRDGSNGQKIALVSQFELRSRMKAGVGYADRQTMHARATGVKRPALQIDGRDCMADGRH